MKFKAIPVENPITGLRVFAHDFDGEMVWGFMYYEDNKWFIKYDDGEDYHVLDMSQVYHLVPIEDQCISVEDVKKLLDDSNERYNQIHQNMIDYRSEDNINAVLICETKLQIIGLYMQRLMEILPPTPNTDNKL